MVLSPREKLALISAGGRIDTPPKQRKIVVQLEEKKEKLSPLQKYWKDKKSKAKLKQDLADIRLLERQDKFKKTLGGRIGRGFRKGVQVGRLGITRSLHERDMTSDQRKRLAIRMRGRPPQRRIIQRPITPEQRHFNNIFSSATPMAHHVERIIMQQGGIANEGDNVAFNLARPGFGNVFQDMERDVMSFANIQHINPVAKVSKDVLSFANIIS